MPRQQRHNVLITGSTSSLGRHMVMQLYYDKGVDFVIATGDEPKPYFFDELNPDRFLYTQVNLTKSRELNNLFYSNAFIDHQIDTIIHLAFKVSFDPKRRALSHKLNIDATRMMLDMAAASETVRKFIFRSSHQVYRLTAANSVYVDEESDLNFETNANQWIRDRVDADMLCRARMGSPDLDVVVLRLSNLIGMNVKSQFYWFLTGAVAHTPLGYDPMINLLHTKDAVRAFQLALHKKTSGVYNIVGRDTAPLSVIARLNKTRRVPLPEPALPLINRFQRWIKATTYDFDVHGLRLKYSALMDGSRAKKDLNYTPIHHADLG